VIFTPKWQAQENTQKQQQQQGKVFSCFGGALSPGKPKTPSLGYFLENLLKEIVWGIVRVAQLAKSIDFLTPGGFNLLSGGGQRKNEEN